MDQSSIVVNGLAIVCIFSLLGLYFGHSFACERLTNSEKAQICISTSQEIVTIINCFCEIFLTFSYCVIMGRSC